jgi:hypothetical protein
MNDHEPAELASLPAVAMHAAAAERLRDASQDDSRLGRDEVSAAARAAIGAWAAAVAGRQAALAVMASPDAVHWLLHPVRKGWQVAPGPTVNEIEIWAAETEADPPRLRVSYRFSGRKQAEAGTGTGDGDADETQFVGMLNLGLEPAGWRLLSGHVETLDDFLGYVFTSRLETPDEHRRRVSGTGAPTRGGGVRLFRIAAGFAEHDVRFGASVSIDVERASAPSRDEAVDLVWPSVEPKTTKALGEGDWQPSLNWLDVIELLPDLPEAG